MDAIAVVLILWTPAVGTAAGPVMDWRPLATFSTSEYITGKVHAMDMCEKAAKELQLKTYKCVRVQ